MDDAFDVAVTASLHALKKEGIKASATVTFSALMAAIHPVLAEVRDLKRQIAALEKSAAEQKKNLYHLEKGAVKMQHDWQADRMYSIGDLVKHSGGLFIALAENLNRVPGSAGCWDRL